MSTTLLLAGCTDKAVDRPAAIQAAETALVLTGSSTLVPVMREIAARFHKLHPDVRIDVSSGGSSQGITDVRAGKAGIGMVSRALKDEENDLTGFPMARDGVAVVVHQDNPVSSLSRQQLQDIFSGKTTRWEMVGGANSDIYVITRDKGRSALEIFASFLGFESSMIKAQESVGDNSLAFEALKNHRNGVTVISLGETQRRMKTENIKPVSVDDVSPTRRSIMSGNYPISRALSLVTKEPPAGLKKDFIDFSLSPQVSDIVENNDFVAYLD